MNSYLNIHIINQYDNFDESLLMAVIKRVSPVPVVFDLTSAPQLEIRGPLVAKKNLGRRVVRRMLGERVEHSFYQRSGTQTKVILYHTEENTRYNAEPCDFSISSDLSVGVETHFRMPNWWCSIDWSKVGVEHRQSPRISKLIKLETLLRPLGEGTLQRQWKAAIFASHLAEPRGTLFRELSSVIEIDGYGKAFNENIESHNNSGIFKDEMLTKYAFSLCPENSMYPGYYTEKVPEAFACGCIPIGWADQNIRGDFNKEAFINLGDYGVSGYGSGFREQLNPRILHGLVSTPLLDRVPDIEGFVRFVERVVARALR